MHKDECFAYYHIVLFVDPDGTPIDDSLKNILCDYLEIRSISLGCTIFKITASLESVQINISLPPKISLDYVITYLKEGSANYIVKNLKTFPLKWKDEYMYKTLSREDMGNIFRPELQKDQSGSVISR